MKRTILPYVAIMILCASNLVLQFRVMSAERRANDWFHSWQTDTTSLLTTDKKNRTTIMRYSCVLEKQGEFTREINNNLRAGRIRAVSEPDLEECMKLEAGDLK